MPGTSRFLPIPPISVFCPRASLAYRCRFSVPTGWSGCRSAPRCLTYVMALVGVFVVTLNRRCLAPTFVATQPCFSTQGRGVRLHRELGCRDHRHHSRLGPAFGIGRIGVRTLPAESRAARLDEIRARQIIAYTAVTVAAAIVVSLVLNFVIVSVAGVGMRMGMSPTALWTGQERRRVREWQRGREPAVLGRPDGECNTTSR